MCETVQSSDSGGQIAALRRRWIRFSLRGLLFLVLCVCGFFAGYRFGYDGGYRQGQRYRSSEDFVTKTYDVRELVTTYGPTSDGSLVPDFDSLIELVKNAIEPDSWDDVGGLGSIVPYEGSEQKYKIVIRQNAYGHEEITRLFESMRRRPDITAAGQWGSGPCLEY